MGRGKEVHVCLFKERYNKDLAVRLLLQNTHMVGSKQCVMNNSQFDAFFKIVFIHFETSLVINRLLSFFR